MTAIVAVRTHNAVAMSSDSRSCLSIPDDTAPGGVRLHPFDDSSPKIAIVADRVLIGWAGTQTHDTVEESLAVLVADAAVREATDPLVIGAAIAAVLTRVDACLLIAFCEPSGRPRVYVVRGGRFEPWDLDESKRPIAGVYPAGYGFAADEIVNRLVTPKFPIGNYSAQKAVDCSRWIVQAIIDAGQFEPGLSSLYVAPPIVSAVVEHRGARMVNAPPPIAARSFGLAAAG